jgi:hypothetical protein
MLDSPQVVPASHLELALAISFHPFHLSYGKDFACQQILLRCSIHKCLPSQLHPSSLVLGALQPRAAEIISCAPKPTPHCRTPLLLPLDTQQKQRKQEQQNSTTVVQPDKLLSQSMPDAGATSHILF